MSADHYYHIEFTSPPTEKRIGEIAFHLIDAFSVSEFVWSDYVSDHGNQYPKEKYILTPSKVEGNNVESLDFDYDELEIPNAVFYSISPTTSAHFENYERGNIWVHIFLLKYFLSQSDVEGIYRGSDCDDLGGRMSTIDIENLLNNFVNRGYFSLGDEDAAHIPVNPTHPDCICGKPLRHNCSSTDKLNFLCVAQGCQKRPVRFFGKDAENLMQNGILPEKYKKYDDGGCDVWVPDNQTESKLKSLAKKLLA